MTASRVQRGGGLDGLIVATFGLFGLRIGLQPIHDNSMFLHLRTGIDMARTGHVPRSDSYSFTALHHAWVVQSWFAELTYGVAYRVGGIHLVILEQGLLMAGLAMILATLARTGSTPRTIAAGGVTVFAGAALLSQRPLVFGLLGLALLILVVERRWSAWWLLPIGWVWVNAHGSFPLGVLWLAAVYVGAFLDQRRRPSELDRYVVAFIASLALSMINPLGPRLLTFPLVVQSKQKVFANIIEWRSPNFQSADEFFALVFFGLALVILLRRGALWRDVIPVVGFLALGLVSLRNLGPAAVVLAPALGRALRPPRVPSGSAPGTEVVEVRADAGAREGPAARLFPAVLVLAAAVFVVGSYRGTGLKFSSYPVAAERYLASHGLRDGRHVVTQDYVGDYRELVEGPSSPSKVFIDDRYDMYPTAVSEDYDLLVGARPQSIAVLNRWHVDVVMWSRSAALPDLLRLAGGWRTVYSDKSWQVLVRDPGEAPQLPPAPPAT